jgi:hydrogenase nickel incorporation protein HypA/HybF
VHEFSISEALVAEVKQIAVNHGALRVQSVKLRIGPLCGVEASLLLTAYPFASAGTIAEGSTLEIEPVSLRIRCQECDCESEAEPGLLTCKTCGSCLTRVVSGEELLLMSVELITS